MTKYLNEEEQETEEMVKVDHYQHYCFSFFLVLNHIFSCSPLQKTNCHHEKQFETEQTHLIIVVDSKWMACVSHILTNWHTQWIIWAT